MNIEQVRDFTLSLHGVTEDQPFGDDNITFRVEGKIFLCLWLGDGKCDVCGSTSRFACKLLPDRNEELRDRYDANVWKRASCQMLADILTDTFLVAEFLQLLLAQTARLLCNYKIAAI